MPESEEEKKVQPIATSCRDCIFAVREGHVQIDCEFDRLEKFDENGAEVVGNDDGDKQYCVILGRFCNACRNEAWGKLHPPQDWRRIVEEEFAVQVAMVTYVDDGTSLVELERTLQSILDQTHKAHMLTIVLNRPSLQTRTYVNLVRSINPPMKWEVRDIKEEGADYGVSIDLTIINCKSTYYCVCKAGHVYPPNFLRTIENAINQEMLRFVAILPNDDGNGLVVQTSLHKLIRGNKEMGVIDKVRDIAKEEETGHMIKAFEDLPLCDSQSS